MNHEDGPDNETMMLMQYMDDVKDRILANLTPLQKAALNNDFGEFCFEYRNECAYEFDRNNLY